MQSTNHPVKALVACQNLSYFIQAQQLRNFVDVMGTVSTPQDLCDRSYDADIGVIFFIGKGDEDWQNALMEARENSPNQLLAIYALDDSLNVSKKAWSEDSYLDDYLVMPKERERLVKHIQSINNITMQYSEMLKDVKEEESIAGEVFQNLFAPNFLESSVLKTSYEPLQLFSGQILLTEKRENNSIVFFLSDLHQVGPSISAVSMALSELFYDVVHQDLSLEEMASEMNEAFYGVLTRHMSLPYLLVELSVDLELKIINAGMPPVILNSAASFQTKVFHSSSLALGIVAPEQYKICAYTTAVNPEDHIVFCNMQLLCKAGFENTLLAYEWLEHLIKKQKGQSHLYETLLYEICQKMAISSLNENQILSCLTVPSLAAFRRFF